MRRSLMQHARSPVPSVTDIGRSARIADPYRTGWILALTMLLTGPVFAIVYTLAGLGAAETFFGNGGGRGPWLMAVTGAVLAVCAPGALRRTRRGMEEEVSN